MLTILTCLFPWNLIFPLEIFEGPVSAPHLQGLTLLFSWHKLAIQPKWIAPTRKISLSEPSALITFILKPDFSDYVFLTIVNFRFLKELCILFKFNFEYILVRKCPHSRSHPLLSLKLLHYFSNHLKTN